MNSRKRYCQAARIFEKVCDLDQASREAALDRACRGDAALRAEVDSLLKYHVKRRSRATRS